ncbi:MAG: PHP domain-containing protein [Hadesarchaea archaeon]|nr:PHP domain-containing protein [Hadesarchaea archaeon]
MWVTVFKKEDLHPKIEKKLLELLEEIDEKDDTFKYVENADEFRIYSRTENNAQSRGKWVLERLGVFKGGKKIFDIDYSVSFVEGMVEKKADLHVRTTASDGVFRPEEAVRLAEENGMEAIAIVDHDTIAGIEPAISATEYHDVEVIPGVELCYEREPKGVHIIGYFIDWEDPNLQEKLKQFQDSRRNRMNQILDKLSEIGIDISPHQVLREAGEGDVISRLHIARAMMKSSVHVNSVGEAFEKYLSSGKPAFVKKFQLQPPELIKLIKDAGGVPALAHPKFSEAEEELPLFARLGLKAIEVKHPSHTEEDVKYFKKLAHKYGLIQVGGTDWHGIEQEVGDENVPYDAVESLKELKTS